MFGIGISRGSTSKGVVKSVGRVFMEMEVESKKKKNLKKTSEGFKTVVAGRVMSNRWYGSP